MTTGPGKRNRVVWWLWVLSMAGVLAGSLLPPEWAWMRPIGAHFNDKVIHFATYFWLSGLAMLAHGDPRQAVLRALLMGVFGMAMELAQSFTRWRSADLLDALANWLGALTGVAYGRWLR